MAIKTDNIQKNISSPHVGARVRVAEKPTFVTQSIKRFVTFVQFRYRFRYEAGKGYAARSGWVAGMPHVRESLRR